MAGPVQLSTLSLEQVLANNELLGKLRVEYGKRQSMPILASKIQKDHKLESAFKEAVKAAYGELEKNPNAKKGDSFYDLLRPVVPQKRGAAKTDFVPVKKLPATEIIFEDRNSFYRIHGKNFDVKLDQYVKNVEVKVRRKLGVDQIVLWIKNNCLDEQGYGSRTATTEFRTNLTGQKGVIMCFGMLSSPTTSETPKSYWLKNWKETFDHEYKHLLDYVRLGVDPFKSGQYLIASRGDLQVHGLLPPQVVIADDPQVDAQLAYVISEVRVETRRLSGEPATNFYEKLNAYTDAVIAKNIQKNNWGSLFVDEIVLKYALNNKSFASVMSTPVSLDKLKAQYAKLKSAREQMTRNPAFLAIYNELEAHAKLAAKEGFVMKEE